MTKKNPVNENKIQEWIERQLKRSTSLIEHIKNVDEVQKITPDISEDKIPTFRLDTLTRHQAVMSAQRAIPRLSNLEVVSARNNISPADNIRLMPDLILRCRKSGTYIIAEIKRSEHSERETLTQLLAYEHEARNSLPFISGARIILAVLSTEFSEMLEHACAQVLTWGERDLICLKVDTEPDPWTLELVLPIAWTPLRTAKIRKSDFASRTVSLTPINDISREHAPVCIDGILYSLTLESQRIGSHGFAVYWQGIAGTHHITFTQIDTAHIIGSILEDGTSKIRESAIALAEHKANGMLQQDPALAYLLDVIRDASFEIFKMAEGASGSWAEAEARMRKSGFPLSFDSWGQIGSLVRQYAVSPGVRKYVPDLKYRAQGPRCATTGLSVISRLSSSIFARGDVTPIALMKLGVLLGTAHAISGRHAESRISLLRVWLDIDFALVLEDLQFLHVSTLDLKNCLPVTVAGVTGPTLASSDYIEQLHDWVLGTLVGERHPPSAHAFRMGYEGALILTEAIPSEILAVLEKSEAHKRTRERLEAWLDRFLYLIATAIAPDEQAVIDREREDLPVLNGIIGKLAAAESSTFDGISATLDLSDDELRDLSFETVLLISKLLPTVGFKVGRLARAVLDWDGFKISLLELQKDVGPGTKVGLFVGMDGSVGTRHLPAESEILGDVDISTHFLVYYERSGGLGILEKFAWEDVKKSPEIFTRPSGSALEDGSRSGPAI